MFLLLLYVKIATNPSVVSRQIMLGEVANYIHISENVCFPFITITDLAVAVVDLFRTIWNIDSC